MTDRWEHIEKICQAALELGESQRAGFLDEACADNAELRREVESLLQFETRGDRFIEEPAVEAAAKMIAHEKPESLPGQQLGSYQILSLIGAGGMGVVYKARDTRLNRSVAIKVLPQDQVIDPERKRRFIQEARAASALNHPNIITIHDIGSEGGIDFIAMEYVDGKTLDQLIPRHGMRLSEALKLAVQMADALAKAHSAGIVHRDLKPGNLMVTEDGVVKVLDFGLAKLTEVESGEEVTRSLESLTETGMIVGTVSYMSPEQAEGKKVDVRSDIFSFGSVLYEMVTGRRAFQGGTPASTQAAILKDNPKPASQIVEALPKEAERLISRCLRKERERRWQTMADLKVALEELKEESDSGSLETPAVVRPRPRRWLKWAIGVAAMLVITAVAVWFIRSKGGTPEPPLAVIPLTSYPGFETSPSFSPDGNQVAFSWSGEKEDNYDIYLKLIGSPKPLRLTSDPAWDGSPAFSPDGRSIAFVRISGDRVAIILIPAIGGPERILADFRAKFRREWGPIDGPSLAWFPDGKWIATSGLGLLSVETGEMRRLTSLPTEAFRDYDPAISPDGRTVAFSRSDYISEIYLLDLTSDLKPKGEPRRLTFMNRYSGSPTWTPDGREIIFVSATEFGSRLWRVAASGSGTPTPLPAGGEKDYFPAVSRQGNRMAFMRRVSDSNIWRLPLAGAGARGNPPERFLSSTRDELNPKYSPDGRHIAFESNRGGAHGIWVSDADGTNAVEVFSQAGIHAGCPRWSPDGQHLVFVSTTEVGYSVYVVRASGGKPVRLTFGPGSDDTATWSHDGNWLYFTWVRNGQSQLWKVPAEGGKALQVTENGGVFPVESLDGKSVYFLRWDRVDNVSLWKIPAAGGVASQVLPSVTFVNFELLDDGIYFIPHPDPNGKAQLQFLSFATNSVKTVATLPGRIFWGLAISPDRRWALYTRDDEAGSDLMLVENFH